VSETVASDVTRWNIYTAAVGTIAVTMPVRASLIPGVAVHDDSGVRYYADFLSHFVILLE